MVSLDNAVLARLEKGGKRYEALVDPDLVEEWRDDSSRVDLDEFMAMDEIFHDARAGERPTEDALMKAFQTLDVTTILNVILEKGSIQLTTAQRKAALKTSVNKSFTTSTARPLIQEASLHIHGLGLNSHWRNQSTQSILSNDLNNKLAMPLQS